MTGTRSVVRTLSDEALLTGLGSGDPDAAAAFVDRFQRRVFGMTLSLGSVFGYQGQPSWLFATLNRPAARPEHFNVQLITRDGRHLSLGETVLGGTHTTWGGQIPVKLTQVSQLRFVAADGGSTMIAYLNARNPWSPG